MGVSVVLNIVYSCVCSPLLDVMNVLGTCCGDLVNGQVFLDEFCVLFHIDTCPFSLHTHSHILTGHAQLNISTSTPTPCYGDVVTLMCHHPELASNRPKYFITTPTWRENGTVIDIADGTIYTADPVDLTCTLLNINITVDHFRNKFFKYSCELLLADENGLPYEVETSREVTVDPVGELLVHT